MTPTTQIKTPNAIETHHLGKQYHGFWALKDCSITVPRGTISALVGPNGAGKTTLLKLLASLNQPSTGTATVLDHAPSQTSGYLSSVSYVAQEIPLYTQFTAADHFAMGRHMETRWDDQLAVGRLSRLRIPLDRPVGQLSGGQRAQVGLAMALAKRPQLLLLDEPVAALDPLARADFLASLAEAAADSDGELTVLMSSHLLADLERVCDHVVLVAAGQTQLCDDIERILQAHKLLVGPVGQSLPGESYTLIREVHLGSTAHLLVRRDSPTGPRLPGWHVRDVDIEEIVLAYMEQNRDNTTKGPRS